MLGAAIEREEVADLDPDALASVLLGAWAEATIHVLTTGQRAPTIAVVDHFLESLRSNQPSTVGASSRGRSLKE